MLFQTGAIALEVGTFSLETGTIASEVETLPFEISTIALQTGKLSLETGMVLFQVGTIAVETETIALQTGKLSLETGMVLFEPRTIPFLRNAMQTESFAFLQCRRLYALQTRELRVQIGTIPSESFANVRWTENSLLKAKMTDDRSAMLIASFVARPGINSGLMGESPLKRTEEERS